MICWLLPYKIHYTYCALAEMIETADSISIVHNDATHNSILPYAFWSGAANPAKNSVAYKNNTVIRNFSHTPIVHNEDPMAVVDSIRQLNCCLTVLPAFDSYVRIFFLNNKWCMIDSRFPTVVREASCSCPSTDTVYYFTQTAFIGSHNVDTRTVIRSTFLTATEPLLGRPALSSTHSNAWLIFNPVSLFACIVVDRNAPVPGNLYIYTAAERCWLIHVFKARHRRQDIYTQWFIHNLEDSSDLQSAYEQIDSHTTSLSESKSVCAKLAKILLLHKATHQENGGDHGETERLQIPSHTQR